MTDSQARPVRRDAAQNRASILAAARLLLAEDPEAKLEDIARAAGLSRRAIYGHFASRDELRRDLAQNGARRVAAAVAEVSHPDARVELALTARTMWREIADVRALAQATVRGPFADDIADALAPLRTSVQATVLRGAESGVFTQDIDPSVLARLVLGAALAVLDETAASGVSDDEGTRLVIAATLGIAGLSWTDAGDIARTVAAIGGPSAEREEQEGA